MKTATLWALLALWAASPALAQSTVGEAAALFGEYHEFTVRSSPEQATTLGRREFNDRWSDLSVSGRESFRAGQRSFLERAQALDPDSLSTSDRLSRELLIGVLTQDLDAVEVEDYLLSLSTLFGLHTRVFMTVAQMPAANREDYENLIARLEALPAYGDQVIALYREAMGAGMMQPRLVAEIAARQIEAQRAISIEESPLLAAFRSFPQSISEQDRDRLRTAANTAYRESFLPTWRRLGEFFAGPYLEATRDRIAASSLADGPALYAALVRRYTTTAITPDRIHSLGAAEVERIEAEMAAIAREAGFDDVASYEEHLRSTPNQRFASKQEMLVYCRNVAKVVDPQLPLLFKKLPRMPFGVRAIPPDREAASASHYNAPAADGSRAAFFNLKAYKPREQVRFDKPALVLHEGSPGHHLQIALSLEIENIPEFRKLLGMGAYVEGWALYAESLGGELGAYPDAASRFGALVSERFRARRLVVDTGLHSKGWSRDRAIAYLGDASEVDRYISWPGQALGYKIGQLKILELRRRAEKTLGDRFDIREFHDVVLRDGPLPLDVLEQQVDSWLESENL